jgi:DNA-binding transcriptional LysR family regulator
LSGALVPVATQTPPEPVQLACLYTHRRHQDPKTRLFMDFMSDRVGKAVKKAEARMFAQHFQ